MQRFCWLSVGLVKHLLTAYSHSSCHLEARYPLLRVRRDRTRQVGTVAHCSVGDDQATVASRSKLCQNMRPIFRMWLMCGSWALPFAPRDGVELDGSLVRAMEAKGKADPMDLPDRWDLIHDSRSGGSIHDVEISRPVGIYQLQE